MSVFTLGQYLTMWSAFLVIINLQGLLGKTEVQLDRCPSQMSLKLLWGLQLPAVLPFDHHPEDIQFEGRQCQSAYQKCSHCSPNQDVECSVPNIKHCISEQCRLLQTSLKDTVNETFL